MTFVPSLVADTWIAARGSCIPMRSAALVYLAGAHLAGRCHPLTMLALRCLSGRRASPQLDGCLVRAHVSWPSRTAVAAVASSLFRRRSRRAGGRAVIRGWCEGAHWLRWLAAAWSGERDGRARRRALHHAAAHASLRDDAANVSTVRALLDWDDDQGPRRPGASGELVARTITSMAQLHATGQR